MVEIVISQRAQKISIYLCLPISPSSQSGEGPGETFIRQRTLADELGCSRRTIGRALTELKNAGLLVDLNKRHENRCKMYLFTPRLQQASQNLTPQAEYQLKTYRYTFEVNFKDWPDWEEFYPQVTWELAREKDVHVLWRKTFDNLYLIQAAALRNAALASGIG